MLKSGSCRFDYARHCELECFMATMPVPLLKCRESIMYQSLNVGPKKKKKPHLQGTHTDT